MIECDACIVAIIVNRKIIRYKSIVNSFQNGDECIQQAVLEVVSIVPGKVVVESTEDEFTVVFIKVVKLAEDIMLLVILVIFIEDELDVVVDSTVLKSEITLYLF